jgi:hypothetical protein
MSLCTSRVIGSSIAGGGVIGGWVDDRRRARRTDSMTVGLMSLIRDPTRYTDCMTSEDVLQELEREPFIPLRLHLSSGQRINIEYPNSASVRQNTLLIVHRLAPGTQAIGNYDVIALRLVDRIEQLNGDGRRSRRTGRRRTG